MFNVTIDGTLGPTTLFEHHDVVVGVYIDDVSAIGQNCDVSLFCKDEERSIRIVTLESTPDGLGAGFEFVWEVPPGYAVLDCHTILATLLPDGIQSDIHNVTIYLDPAEFHVVMVGTVIAVTAIVGAFVWDRYFR